MQIATVHGYELNFSKVSNDGSGKCGIAKKMNSSVLGVVFEISKTELQTLDKFEGAGNGYDRSENFSVSNFRGEELLTTTYLPTRIDSTLKPYDWYLALVMAGANENNLPNEYIEELRSVPFISDQRFERRQRKIAIEVLKQAGISDFKSLLKIDNK